MNVLEKYRTLLLSVRYFSSNVATLREKPQTCQCGFMLKKGRCIRLGLGLERAPPANFFGDYVILVANHSMQRFRSPHAIASAPPADVRRPPLLICDMEAGIDNKNHTLATDSQSHVDDEMETTKRPHIQMGR